MVNMDTALLMLRLLLALVFVVAGLAKLGIAKAQAKP